MLSGRWMSSAASCNFRLALIAVLCTSGIEIWSSLTQRLHERNQNNEFSTLANMPVLYTSTSTAERSSSTRHGDRYNHNAQRRHSSVPYTSLDQNEIVALRIDSTTDAAFSSSRGNDTVIHAAAAAVASVGNDNNIFGGVRSRAFSKWPSDLPLPCFHPTDDGHPNNASSSMSSLHWTDKAVLKTSATTGLFFLKLLKTAGSTAASIHLRVARNLAIRNGRSTEYDGICKSRFLHGWAGPRLYKYASRNKRESFLWTVVRNPTDRAVSEFFHFAVSRRGKEPTSERFISFLKKSPHMNHHYLSWLSTRRYVIGRSSPKRVANRILNKDYDFVGISERLDESAVALQMILNISLADVLHLSTKNSGGYDDGEYRNRCFKIVPSFVPDPVRAYLNGPEWRDYVEPELALYRAANRSLDRTIDEVLGREAFEVNLAKFRRAQTAARNRCADRVTLPCSRTGQRIPENQTDCLRSDSGCGFDCLDRVATDLGLW